VSAESLPDAWPPRVDTPVRTVVPLFPLAGVFLFPNTLLPLHIFEPRYRQMVEDVLDGPGRIVIGTPLEGESGATPAVHPIAGLGEIARHERLDDGRFVILLAGLLRARVSEVGSDRLYRRVAVEPLTETPVEGAREAELRRRLIQAVRARVSGQLERLEEIPLGNLTDVLLMRLQIPQAAMQDLYSLLAVAERAEGALAEHARCPLPPHGGAPPRRSDPKN
jgi:Lon protease-like protein